MSPISFAMLSGAGVVKGAKGDGGKKIFVHTNYDLVVEEAECIAKVPNDKNPQQTDDKETSIKFGRITNEERNGASIIVSKEAPVYPVKLNSAGAQSEYLSAVTKNEIYVGKSFINDVGENSSKKKILQNPATIKAGGEIDGAEDDDIIFVLGSSANETTDNIDGVVKAGDTVRIDCYEVHTDGAYEMTIDASTFAGYYYIEASTLFRDEETGEDLPAEFIIPRGKIQSNFTFTMANSGDPSTSSVGVAA